MACASQPSSDNPISMKMRSSAKDSCSPEHIEYPSSPNWLRELYAMKYDLGGMAHGIRMDYDSESVESYWISATELDDMIEGGKWLELSHLALWGS